MAAVYVSNLVVNTGSTFNQTFTLENAESSAALNLTGYTVKSQMRKHSASTTATDFTSTISNATGGQIQVGLTSTTTAALKPGRYVYDVIITDNVASITRVIEGSVLVREGVTR